MKEVTKLTRDNLKDVTTFDELLDLRYGKEGTELRNESNDKVAEQMLIDNLLTKYDLSTIPTIELYLDDELLNSNINQMQYLAIRIAIKKKELIGNYYFKYQDDILIIDNHGNLISDNWPEGLWMHISKLVDELIEMVD